MSDLPAGWEHTTLESVADWSSGGTPSRAIPSNYQGSIPWIKTGELGPRTIRHTEESISEAAIEGSSAKIFPSGSVALAMYGATIGKVSILGVDAATNQACAVGTPKASSSEFLYYFLQSQAESFAKAGKGGAQPNISQGIVKAWSIDLPPLGEQTRIIEKLEELLSDLDAGVAELNAAQRKLAQYRQSLLKAAVEGALTQGWRARNTPRETGADLLQRILRERRARWEQKQLAKFAEQGKTPPKGWQAKYPEPVAPPVRGELTVPSTWVWAGIEQLADGGPHALKAGPFGSALKKEFYTPTGYKVYGQEQVIRGDPYFGDYFIPREKYEELISCATRPGDLLISLVGTTGKVLMLPQDARPGIINPRLLKVSLSPGNVRPAYVQLVLESPHARHFFKLNAHGGTMDVLNLGILKELAIPLPELAEQDEIVRRVDAARESIEQQSSAIDRGLRHCAAQRKNLLRAAFAGQLVPQDPRDEPASELLARIRAARAGQDGKSAKPRGRRRKESA